MVEVRVVRRSTAMRKPFALLTIVAIGAAVAAFGALPLRALSGKPAPALPHDLGQLYATLDRGDLLQYRELFAPAAALAAIEEGKPLPAGTVLTMVVYSIKRDDAGHPLKDVQGRFVKDRVSAFFVMRKQGEGARPSSGPARGPWQFQLFGADRRPDRNARMTDCAACHQRRNDEDFVFSGEEMRAFAADHTAR
jgi:hypothetical protein